MLWQMWFLSTASLRNRFNIGYYYQHTYKLFSKGRTRSYPRSSPPTQMKRPGYEANTIETSPRLAVQLISLLVPAVCVLAVYTLRKATYQHCKQPKQDLAS